MREPDYTKPVDIRETLSSHFGVCGCTETGYLVDLLIKYLVWAASPSDHRQPYDAFDLGEFYLVVGLLDHNGLVEHGISIRHPWITPQGRIFLNSVRNLLSESDLDNAKGESCRGYTYGACDEETAT